jgi:hypothetical protein
MVDRNDIDALLIGSLYGELSSADEARLKAHLESHPADRAALEGLTRTRSAVRASRIFEVQLEPAQSVSALLMQEAARRAPRKAQASDAEEGWFARLRRTFLFSPAFAAAAMLVVVVGVAGTVYMRQGDHFASPELSAPAVATLEEAADRAVAGSGFAAAPAAPAPAAAADPAAVTATPPPPPASAQGLDSGRRDEAYRVDLAEGDARGAKAETVAADGDTVKPAEPVVAAKPKKGARPAALEISTPQHLPKELGAAPESAKTARVASQEAPEQGAARPADAALEQKRSYAAAPPARAPESAPPPPPAAAVAKDTSRSRNAPTAPGGGAAGGDAAATGATADKVVAVDANLSWARDQHSRLVTQVKAGRCREAADTAVALSNRAPGYFQQNVENDRDVKNCLAYINAELESTAEQAQRARATTRRAGDEPAAKGAAPSKRTPTKAAPADSAPPATKRN